MVRATISSGSRTTGRSSMSRPPSGVATAEPSGLTRAPSISRSSSASGSRPSMRSGSFPRRFVICRPRRPARQTAPRTVRRPRHRATRYSDRIRRRAESQAVRHRFPSENWRNRMLPRAQMTRPPTSSQDISVWVLDQTFRLFGFHGDVDGLLPVGATQMLAPISDEFQTRTPLRSVVPRNHPAADVQLSMAMIAAPAIGLGTPRS